MINISVIVPIYNTEKYLDRCIKSILNQTYRNFELILVDDGSVDSSGKICDKYRELDDRVIVVHQDNKGVSYSRNVGISKAKGKYVFFVDSDDYLEEFCLELLISKISNNNSLVIGNVYQCYEVNNSKNYSSSFPRRNVAINKNNSYLIAKLINDRRLNYTHCKLFNRLTIIDNSIAFRDSISLGEDTIFVMEYLKYIDTITIVNEPLYNYVHYKEESLTNRYYYDLYDRLSVVNKEIEITMKHLGIYDDEIKKAINLRRIDSAKWNIDSIINYKKTSYLAKMKLINKVANNRELLETIENMNNEDIQYEEILLIKSGNWNKILNKYYFDKTTQKIKAVLVRILPRKVIDILKNVC